MSEVQGSLLKKPPSKAHSAITPVHRARAINARANNNHQAPRSVPGGAAGLALSVPGGAAGLALSVPGGAVGLALSVPGGAVGLALSVLGGAAGLPGTSL